MNLILLAWALWIVGTVLVLLSWVDVVGPQTGWAGFAVATIGFLLGRIPIGHDHSNDPSPPTYQAAH